jgi:hypothetical protein
MTNIKNIRGAEPTGGQSKDAGEVNDIICTVAIYGGGNILAVDASTAGQGVPYAEDAADITILGITTKGSKDYATKTYDTGARIGYTREGTHDVCLADDNVTIIVGDRLAAESDSITYDGISTCKVGAVDKSAPTSLTTTGDATTHGELAAAFLEYNKVIGLAAEAKASSTGGYIKTLLCLTTLFVIPTA